MSESKVTIPEAAVEAAARAMNPTVWGPRVWTFAAHGETPTDARNRVQQEALQDARRALEAAAPYMLAQAWDRAVESMVYDDGTPVEVMSNNNPYRTTK